MIRLSIIVPFYNVEQYIEQCIRSLYDQDIPQSEYEVICVDDCSPDGSRDIIERLQKEYPTLKLLTHMENKRQGGARNTGMKEAKGQYVWFVDSDDRVCPNVLATILSTAEKNELDILQFGYSRGNGDRINYPPETEEILDGESYLFSGKIFGWTDRVSGPWQQIIRRQFLIDEGVTYIEGAQYEDTDYLIRAFIKARRVLYIHIYGYIYQENQMSTTLQNTSPMKIAWKVNQLVRCAELLQQCHSSKAKEYMYDMLFNAFSAMRRDLKHLKTKEICVYLKNVTPAVKYCRRYMNLPPWLAIRYGITWFI